MASELEHSMRCPHCGGMNDLDAQWCMQCYRRLTEERGSDDSSRADPDTPGKAAPALNEALAATLELVAGREEADDDEPLSSAFTVVDKTVTWVCSGCGHLNDVKVSECAECRRPFKDSARSFALADLPRKQSRYLWKAFGALSMGAVVMRLVGGLISPWAAAAVFGGAALRFAYRYFLARR